MKLTRWLKLGTLSLALAAAYAPTPARAQEPAAEGEDKSGRPVDGYIVTAIFAFAVLFIVGKSARR